MGAGLRWLRVAGGMSWLLRKGGMSLLLVGIEVMTANKFMSTASCCARLCVLAFQIGAA